MENKIEPTPNRTNWAAQSKYVYMTQEAIKTKKTSKNETGMIVSRVASKSIRNTNETEDSNKNRNERCKTMEQHPNMLDMKKINCKKQKQQKETKF